MANWSSCFSSRSLGWWRHVIKVRQSEKCSYRRVSLGLLSTYYVRELCWGKAKTERPFEGSRALDMMNYHPPCLSEDRSNPFPSKKSEAQRQIVKCRFSKNNQVCACFCTTRTLCLHSFESAMGLSQSARAAVTNTAQAGCPKQWILISPRGEGCRLCAW